MRLFPTPNVSVAVPIKDNGDSVVARGRSSKGLGQGGARDLRLTDLLLMHPPNNATFVHTQLHNRASRSILLKSWPILSKLHLKKGTCRRRLLFFRSVAHPRPPSTSSFQFKSLHHAEALAHFSGA